MKYIFTNKNRNKIYRILAIFILSLLLITMMPFKVTAQERLFQIDGYTDDWDNLPSYYTYNWDNSMNCWRWGVWINGKKFTTPEGTYDTTVRHKMKMYNDKNYIYLLIEYSLDYQPLVNGDDFNFTVNGETKKYRITLDGHKSITGNTQGLVDGPNEVCVTTENKRLVSDATAYLNMKNNRVNNILELCIPMSEFKYKNNFDGNTISFFTPNLMYEKIQISGTSTGGLFLIIVCTGIAIIGLFFINLQED